MSYRVTAPLVLAKDPEGKTHHRYEGEVIQWLSPEQAKHFTDLGLVVKVGGSSTPEPAADGLTDGAGDGDSAEGRDDTPEKPKQAAPKPDWVKYASSGAPEGQRLSYEAADALTKKELIERFG